MNTTGLTRVLVRDVLRATAEQAGVSLSDLICESRAAILVRPRQRAMYVAKEVTTASFPAIGRQLGGRDHTTIMSGIARFQAVRDYQPTKGWLEHPSIVALIERI